MYKLSEKTEHLANCPLFERIPYDELKLIAFTAEEFFHKKGDIVFEEGDEALEAFIIFKGEVEAYKKTSDKREEILTTLTKNNIFGEFAIISSCPRTASVRVTEDVSGIKIDKDTFINIINEFPEVSLRIMDFLVQKLVETQNKLIKVIEQNKK